MKMKLIDLVYAADNHPFNGPLPEAASRRATRERAQVSKAQMAVVVGASETAVMRWEAGMEPKLEQHRISYGRVLAYLERYDQISNDLASRAATVGDR